MGLAAFNRARRLAAEKAAAKQEQKEQTPVQAVDVSFNGLRAEAKRLNIEGYGKMGKEQLQQAIASASEV